jgi:nitrile hydratase accessory protein
VSGGDRDVRADGFGEPSLPRSNGAPVFDAPWQARAMAMAVLVVEAAGRPWDDFRCRLVEAIGEDGDRPYWSSWVVALDRLVKDLGLVLPDL